MKNLILFLKKIYSKIKSFFQWCFSYTVGRILFGVIVSLFLVYVLPWITGIQDLAKEVFRALVAVMIILLLFFITDHENK